VKVTGTMFGKYRKHLPLFLSLIGFLLVEVPLSQVHVASDFTSLPLGEFFLEEIAPIWFWLGLALIVVSTFLSLKSDRTSIVYLVLSSVFLIVAMRAVIPLIMSKPYGIDVFDYAYWLKVWLKEGFQFTPGPSIPTPLLPYYPHTNPIAFLIAYAFVRGGVSMNVFFAWAPSVIYAIDVVLVFFLARAIGFTHLEAAVATFLIAQISFTDVITQYYCPQLVGSATFLLSMCLIVKVSKSAGASAENASVRNKNLTLNMSRPKKGIRHIYLQILTMMSILLLIFTHHLSTLYFIIVLLGFFLTQRLLRRFRFTGSSLQVSPFWIVYTSTLWAAIAYFVYPDRLVYWIDTAGTFLSQFLSGTARGLGEIHGVSTGYWLNLPLLDKISSSSYAIAILVLCVVQVVMLSKINGKDSNPPSILKRLGGSLFNNEMNSTILGLISGLAVFLVFGLLLGGFGYPMRVLSFLMIFLSMIAAQPLTRAFDGLPSKRMKLLVVAIMILLVFLSAHWIFRTFQRNVPAWEREIPEHLYP
jgi:hypothetical protein